MISIAKLLDSAKAKAGIESDYRLAKVIGITHSVISGYRLAKSMPNEKILAQLCALSGDDVAVVAAEIQALRAQSPEGKNMWLMIAKRLAGGAGTAILSVLFSIALIAGIAEPAQAADREGGRSARLDFIYIVSSTFLSVASFLLVRLRFRNSTFRRLLLAAVMLQ